LKALKDTDDQRKAKEAALNDLEAYIYKVKNRIMDDEDKLKKVSTDEQRQEVLDLSNTTEEWLYEDQSAMTVTDYKKKQKEISVKAEAIFLRFSELTARPKTVEKALATLANVTSKIETWNVSMPHITAAEIEKLQEVISKAQTWITENSEKQEKANPIEDPIFLSSDVAGQLKPVSVEFEKLMRKPKPVPPKVKSSANKTTSSNSTKEEDETVRVNVNATEDFSTSTDETEKKEAEEEVKITEETEGKSDL
jgi:hypoxia up-regulated 1